MPVSEDEYERPVQMGTNPAPLSKAEQRKNNKPIMEKRRRARINHCLNELKTLILDAMKKDPARHSKLEKADILEMTVKHLQQIQRQQLATAVAGDPGVIMRFKSGFDECAAEVSRYIGRLEGIDNGVKQRLTAHLHRCVSSLQHVSASAFPHQTMFASLAQNCDKSNTIVLPNVPSIPGDVNNNSNQNGDRIQIPGGLQLIPSRLPTGEFALLLPNSNHMSTFLNAPTGATFQFPANTTVSLNTVLSPTLGGALGSNASHASAFTAVTKAQDYPSPTSTADIIKKESNLSEKDNFNSTSYLNRVPESSIHQNYKFKVTNTREITDLQADEHNYKNSKLSLPGHDLTDGSQNNGNMNGFGRKFSEGTDHDLKISQKATLNSFQKNVADSTTSSFQPKDEEIHESGFKSFQVEIPNSHLKAHISLSRPREETPSPALQIPKKLSPNFIPEPTKTYQKSSLTTNNEFDYAKSKPLSVAAKGDDSKLEMTYPSCSLSMLTPAPLPKDTSPTSFKLPDSQGQRSGKRPLSNGSPEMCSTTGPCEPNPKMPRISLNVTLTENHQPPLREQSYSGNKCKRISVIVEDSSKNVARDGNNVDSDSSNNRHMAMTGSSQRDMWRPW